MPPGAGTDGPDCFRALAVSDHAAPWRQIVPDRGWQRSIYARANTLLTDFAYH